MSGLQVHSMRNDHSALEWEVIEFCLSFIGVRDDTSAAQILHVRGDRATSAVCGGLDAKWCHS